MYRRATLVCQLIVGLFVIGSTNAGEAATGKSEPPSTQPRSFMIDAESASLEERRRLGIDLDSKGMLDARDAAIEFLPGEPGQVKNSRLIVIDPVAFEPGFFDGPIFIELPTSQSCVAHPLRSREAEKGDTEWIGRCESGMGDGDSIVLRINPSTQLITGFISWGWRQYEISSTRMKPFQVIHELDADYVSDRRATY